MIASALARHGCFHQLVHVGAQARQDLAQHVELLLDHFQRPLE